MNLNVLYPHTELRKANPCFARKTVLSLYENLKSISVVAKVLRTTRKTVRAIIKRHEKYGEDGLRLHEDQKLSQIKHPLLPRHQYT